MPLPENLVLNHLHLVLALTVLLQLGITPDVLQKNLFYLTTLVVRHHLRHLLGRGLRGRRRQTYILLAVPLQLLKFRIGTLKRRIFSL